MAKAWYRQASGTTPKPSRHEFTELHRERSALYRAKESPGAPIPVRLNQPFTVLDDPPTEDEVADACLALKTGRAPGPSGIRPEHLREWLKDYQSDSELLSPERWENVLTIVEYASPRWRSLGRYSLSSLSREAGLEALVF